MSQSTPQKPKLYHLPPTPLIPNSPYPLLHYPNFLSLPPSPSPSPSPTTSTTTTPTPLALATHDLFHSNTWRTQWIYRYGPTQPSHYHSTTHEAMAVLSGCATIRFGVADTSPDPNSNTYGGGHEDGGVELQAHPGDVFVIPAGVAHKTFDATQVPREEGGGGLVLLTPGDGHGVFVEDGKGDGGVDGHGDVRKILQGVQCSGFTMLGAYPEGGEWDFAVGGEELKAGFEGVWKVSVPVRDPVLGEAREGVCGVWV